MSAWQPGLLAIANPVAHVIDKPIWTSPDGSLWYVSNASVMLVLGAVVTIAVVVPPARRIRPGQQRTIDELRTQGLWANLVESVCVYLRDQVFRPVLGEETDRYTPVLWTFFWYILICNLLGLVPLADVTAGIGALLGYEHFHGVGGTATQSIWVTGALAALAFLFFSGAGLVRDPVGFLKHLTGGAPWFMWPIMVPVEIMGMFVKPVALALRLFANMTGGHIILAVLLSFVVALIQNMGVLGWPLAVAPVLGATAINLLEILVAFIQAFIFTFLTCLFLGQQVVHEHEDAEHHHSTAPQPQTIHSTATGDSRKEMQTV